MPEKPQEQSAPPEISPYCFPIILAVLGAWCFYDGWLTSNPEMLEHMLFNRVVSAVLLLWALVDFVRTRRADKVEKSRQIAGPEA